LLAGGGNYLHAFNNFLAMVTIIFFYAFNRPMQHVFTKGESLYQIHRALNEICPQYDVIQILQGKMENTAIKNLTTFKTGNHA
jgi:hypothetical protein